MNIFPLIIIYILSSIYTFSTESYSYFENPNKKVNLLEGEALVILSSTRNQTIQSDDYILIKTPSGNDHKLTFLDINTTYARISTYENKSYGFGMSSTTLETRTIVGPATVSISGNFYVAYKITHRNPKTIKVTDDEQHITVGINSDYKKENPKNILLEITKYDSVRYAGKTIGTHQLFGLLDEIFDVYGPLPVIIRAHEKTSHRAFSKVHSEAIRAGAMSVKFSEPTTN